MSSPNSSNVASNSAPPRFLQDFKNSIGIPLNMKWTDILSQRKSKLDDHFGKEVEIYGFLTKRIDVSAQLCFMKLTLAGRYHQHIIQVVAKLGATDSNVIQQLKSIRPHSAVYVSGTLVPKKDPGAGNIIAAHGQPQQDKPRVNPEIILKDIKCLAEFPEDIIITKDKVFEPDQRHLELRFDPSLGKRIRFRHEIVQELRKSCPDLAEIETPILFKSTPEGAREFLVPTRKPGYAYALPQSPQQYKQILMASGFNGYFQVAKCFRDEDLRADRQPEFTQFDLELAFADGASVMRRVEGIIKGLYKKFEKFHPQMKGLDFTHDFLRMSYQEAMEKFGSDKPDLSISGHISRVDKIMPRDSISMLTSLSNPVVEAIKIRIKGTAEEGRKFVQEFMESPEGRSFQQNPDGAPGVFVYDPRKPLEGLQTFGHEGAEALKSIFSTASIPKSISDEIAADEISLTVAEEPLIEGDVIIVQARKDLPLSGGSTALGRIRTTMHKAAGHLVDVDQKHYFLWVIDFPLFTPSNDIDPGQGGSSGFSATHHPFTAPKSPEDVDLLLEDPLKVKADHYDLVVNGVELGGGSRRIHNSEMQQFIMRDILKMSEERLKDFSHLFEVLRSGCPPHAGFALGLDRLVAVMSGVQSVRDVIAFPKNGKGEDLLVKSPSLMTDKQLTAYHLRKAD